MNNEYNHFKLKQDQNEDSTVRTNSDSEDINNNQLILKQINVESAESKKTPDTGRLSLSASSSNSDNSTNDSDRSEYVTGLDELEEVTIRDHSKVVTTIDIEPNGSRFVSAGRDLLKIWDYNGMDTSMKPFRSFEPFAGCVVSKVQYSISGDRILAATSTSQAIIYDRDGSEVLKTINGDPYIVDMRKTNGHIAALTDCAWHPYNKSNFLTASNDGTVRIWDVARTRAQDKIIVIRSKPPGIKVMTTAATYISDGKHIISGSTDGALKLWDLNSPMNVSKITIDAHNRHTCITDVKVIPGEPFVYSRATDNTLKLWDTRNYLLPVASIEELQCSNEKTGIFFSPNGALVITGTSMNQQNKSSLSFFRAQNLNRVKDIHFEGCDVVSVCWNKRLDQIHAGLSNGKIKVYYNKQCNTGGGILLPLNKKVKVNAPSGVGIMGYDPNSWTSGTSTLTHWTGSQKNIQIMEARKSKYRPDPLPGTSGDKPKLGSNLLAPYIAESIKEEAKKKEDPREAILKYAEISDKNPYWISPAYKKNQPKSIFLNDYPESQDEEGVRKKKRKQQK